MAFTADTEQEALAWVIDADMVEQGWTTDDVKVFPCCGFKKRGRGKAAPVVEEAPAPAATSYSTHPAQVARTALGLSWAAFGEAFGGTGAKVGREVLARIEAEGVEAVKASIA